MTNCEEVVMWNDDEVCIKRSKKATRISLRVIDRASLQITAPPRAKKEDFILLLKQNEQWIALQKAKFFQQKLMPSEGVLLFGRWYECIIISDSEKKAGCYLQNNQFFINTISPVSQAQKESEQLFVRFLKITAGAYLPPRLEHWSNIMQTTYKKITLREQVSRWGSCSSSGTIALNWRLIHAPTAVIDYVIIHELAHTQQMNHSPAFWAIVEKFDPAHRSHRGWLKREGKHLIHA